MFVICVRVTRARNFPFSLYENEGQMVTLRKKVVNKMFFPFSFSDIICGPMYSGATPCPIRAPLVVVVVGQPCRGKSLAAQKVARQLNWKGEQAKGMSRCYFYLFVCCCDLFTLEL